jgi:hypothetical protein
MVHVLSDSAIWSSPEALTSRGLRSPKDDILFEYDLAPELRRQWIPKKKAGKTLKHAQDKRACYIQNNIL